MFDLQATNRLPFDTHKKADGTLLCGMYATLALKVITPVEEKNGKIHVELQWIGVADASADDLRELTWTLQGAKEFERTALPLNGEDIILIRYGLPPISLASFTSSSFLKGLFWWEDWQRRATSTQFTAAPGHTVLAWELDSKPMLPRPPIETSAIARDTEGVESRIFLKWHQPAQMVYDIVFKARLEDENRSDEERQKAAAEFIHSVVSRDNWLRYLARVRWLRSIEVLPQEHEHSLEFSCRVHLDMAAGAEFLAQRFAWWLSNLLAFYATPQDSATIKILTQSYEVGLSINGYVTRSRDLYLWPPPVEEERPLRPVPPPDPMLMARLDGIRARIDLLKNIDTTRSIHAANSHKYEMVPCLDEKAIQRIEDKLNIIFPEEYRLFVLHVCNGKAGPGCGIEPLQRSLQYSTGTLQNQFPHHEPYQPHYEADEESEIPIVDEFAEILDPDPETDGALHIASLGCGIGILLVITGPERGNLWVDDRSSDGGIYPISQDELSNRIGFLTWYENWLETSLTKLSAH